MYINSFWAFATVEYYILKEKILLGAVQHFRSKNKHATLPRHSYSRHESYRGSSRVGLGTDVCPISKFT